MSSSVWNRLQTAANTTTTTLVHAPIDRQRRYRHGRRATETIDSSADDQDPDKRFWQQSFDQRLDVLGLEGPAKAPYRYEVHRGKTVPSPGDTPLGSRDYLPSLETANPSTSTSTSRAAPRTRQPEQPEPQQLPTPALRRYEYQSDRGSASDIDARDSFTGHGRHDSEAVCSDLGSDGDQDMYVNTGTRGPRRRMTDAQGVSPPSSPEVEATRRGYSDHDVSPIDDEADMSQQQLLKGPRPAQRAHHQNPHHAQSRGPPPQAHARQSSGQHQKSSIPTMRRERRRQQGSSISAPRPPRQARETGRQTPPVAGPSENQHAVGWEAPVDSRGRPMQETSHDDGQMYGVTTNITSSFARQSKNPSPSLGQRMRQLGRGVKPEPIENRPAWNGASGRQTIVSPVQDDTTVAPLNIPPKSTKRTARESQLRGKTVSQPTQPSTETSKSSSAAAAMRKFIPSRSGHTPEPHGRSSPLPEPATRNAPTPGQSHPSPLQNASPVVSTQTADFQLNSTPPTAPRLSIPNPDKAIRRKPPPSGQENTPSHAVHPSTSSSVYSAQPAANIVQSPATISQHTPKNQAPDDGWVQPPSRFSITTFATSNADSPRHSADENRPPLPEPPQTQSVMDRRRPLRGQESPKSGDHPVVISLKSASISDPIGLGIDKNNTPRSVADTKPNRPSSIMSMSKELPPAPHEIVNTKDRIAVLNANIAGLTHRRNNITKSIKQMTELMPVDKLIESDEVLRKREDEKRKVENLKSELAEIQQQEYDLGLKLHRAYKRQEREASYESGTLWVRRVTS